MKPRLAALFLTLFGFVSAAPTEKDAMMVFTQLLKAGAFNTVEMRGYPQNFIRHEIRSTEWGKGYTEEFFGDEWTVFVVTAVVHFSAPDNTLLHRFSVKAGIALRAKGDEVFMRQAFQHQIGLAPPLTPAEQKELDEEAKKRATEKEETQKRDDAIRRKKILHHQIAEKAAAAFELPAMSLSKEIQVFTSGMGGDLQPSVTISGKDSLSFGITIEDSLILSNGLKKWAEWRDKAKANHVVNFQKDITATDDIKLVFHVSAEGGISLILDRGGHRSIKLTEGEAVALSGFFEKLSADLFATQKSIEDEARKQIEEGEKQAEANKNSGLFE